MKRAILLFLFLFSSLSFAAVSEDVYDSSTKLYRPDLDPDQSYIYVKPNLWFQSTVRVAATNTQQVLNAAGGTYDDLGDGAVICEGEVDVYGSSLGEWAHNNNLYAYSLWTSDGSCTPNSYTSVSEHPVTWNDAHYAIFRDIWSGRCASSMSDCWGEEGTLYGEKVNTYELNDETKWTDGRRGNMNDVCKGQQYLSYGRTGGFFLWTPLANGEPSSTVSSTDLDLNAGTYGFTNSLNVQGCSHIIRQYDESCNLMEYSYTFTTIDGAPEYSKSVASTLDLTVVSEDDVGVVPPHIGSVTLTGYTMTDGHYILEEGADIPAIIKVHVPVRNSDYEYFLGFELDQATATLPFSFSPTSGLHQCSGTPLYNGFLIETLVNVQGTLHVPPTLPEDGGNMQFQVHWQACENQVDCGASGFTGWTDPFEVPYIPPGDDEPPPDLMCTLEPVSISDSDTTTTDLEPGSSIEKWRLVITNIGGDLVLSGTSAEQLGQYMCLFGLFDAWDMNSSGDENYVYPDGLSFYILTSTNLNLTTGESITKILDGEVSCEEEGELGAIAILNPGPFWFPSCAPYYIEESNTGNNACGWTIPCVNESIPEDEDENCTIHPSSVDGELWENYTFDIECDGGNCSGTVSWEADEGGSITESGQESATVEVLSDENMITVTATVNNPEGEDAICYAHILFNGTGDDDQNACHIYETPQTGRPGSYHWFNLECSGDGVEDGLCDNADWQIIQGEEFVMPYPDSYGDLFHWEGRLNQYAINTTIIVEAEVEFPTGGTETCRGEIIVPEIPCEEYI